MPSKSIIDLITYIDQIHLKYDNDDVVFNRFSTDFFYPSLGRVKRSDCGKSSDYCHKIEKCAQKNVLSPQKKNCVPKCIRVSTAKPPYENIE